MNIFITVNKMIILSSFNLFILDRNNELEEEFEENTETWVLFRDFGAWLDERGIIIILLWLK